MTVKIKIKESDDEKTESEYSDEETMEEKKNIVEEKMEEKKNIGKRVKHTNVHKMGAIFESLFTYNMFLSPINS